MLAENRTIGGLRVSYLRREVAEPRATVVFIHGYPFNKTMWARQLDALPEDIQGFAYDIRGFGESEPGQPFFSIELFTEDLLAFLSAFKFDRVILCGVSMGGYIALRSLEKFPERISGLMLIDTTSQPDTSQAKINRFGGIRDILEKGQGSYAAGFLEKIFTAEALEKKDPAAEEIRRMILDTPTAVLCQTLLALASRTDTTPEPGVHTLPVLVLRGEHDRVISPEQALALKRHFLNSSLATVPGSGHLPNMDNPLIFNRLMNGFLSSIAR